MRPDILPSERAFSSITGEVAIPISTSRKYVQILERNGNEFLIGVDWRAFVISDISPLIALRDTNNPLVDTAKDLVYLQKEK